MQLTEQSLSKFNLETAYAYQKNKFQVFTTYGIPKKAKGDTG